MKRSGIILGARVHFVAVVLSVAVRAPAEAEIDRMGFSTPEAARNAQFVLNVAHWLTGLLD